MRVRRLQTRFLLAGCLLVTTTVACGIWSAVMFARLSTVVGKTLRESQETTDLTALLASALEREDDALLLSINGEIEHARRELMTQRWHFDNASARLVRLLQDPEESAAAAALQQHVAVYRTAGDGLFTMTRPEASKAYHERVNPALRRAVSACAKIRELNFRSMQLAGIRARDEAQRATVFVGGVSVGALLISTLVAVLLARTVLRPVHEISTSVEALRLGDFTRRVQVASPDELGQLAEGFNRMAETLSEFRRSNLGEVLRAKETLEAMLAALPDAIIVIDPDGKIVTTNALARAILQAAGAERAQQVRDLPFSAYGLQALRAALHGKVRLRSFYNVLTFIGRDIKEEPEYDVPPDPRTPGISENPVHALEILETASFPSGVDLSVALNGYYYAVRPESGYQWNRKAFSLLYQLFQMTVSALPQAGPAITISK